MEEEKNNKAKGKVTIPTDVYAVEETKKLMNLWGADALRDCDGTVFPTELKDENVKIYGTYYMTRKDNDWIRKHPEEKQQCYVMSAFFTAKDGPLVIPLLQGYSPEMLDVHRETDIQRWWEVIDRTENKLVSPKCWRYDETKKAVQIDDPKMYHEYTVSFLADLIWDPVHMYNSITSGWQQEEHQIPFDVRKEKTKEFSFRRLQKYIDDHPYVDVIRFTTFFHQFTLLFDEERREKYVDWYGYSASVSPEILEDFEKETKEKFRPEWIVDEGYYQNQYRIPSKNYMKFIHFQNREVCKLIRDFTDLVHRNKKEAMMFLGDHWIGTEPYLEEFSKTGIDAVVGSVGNGTTCRLIADIPNVKYREGRLLPYFFKDVFHEGGNPLWEAKINWARARRALLRKPLDRIGYGGYLKLAAAFPDFVEYVSKVCNEFRELSHRIGSTKPFVFKRVAVLNCFGKMRSFGAHMVHHAIYHRENYSYWGVLEILAGAPFDVDFLNFEDLLEKEDLLSSYDVLFNIGDADTAQTGGIYFENPKIVCAIRKFVEEGGGFIGVGEPSGHPYSGHFFQLAELLGVEKETGFTLGYGKYNTEEVSSHFILADASGEVDFGEEKKSIYALPETEILKMNNKSVALSVHQYGKGRAVYMSGLPDSCENRRILHRSILYASGGEHLLYRWFSENPAVEVHAYPEKQMFCAVNGEDFSVQTLLFRGDGSSFEEQFHPFEIKWYYF